MFSPELVAEIVTLGAVVLGITQAFKKWTKLDGWKALIVSAVVSVLLALWRALSLDPVDWSRFVILALGGFLEANGIYHFGAKAIGKDVKQQN